MRSPLPGAVCDSPINKTSVPLSLHTTARDEANCHKWIESQKHGRDLGNEALEDWYRHFWHNYCCAKRIEHLTGRQRWLEFADHEFGRMHELLMSGNELLKQLLALYERGKENLDVICWAMDRNLSMDDVHPLMEMININIARLDPRNGS